jgi:hypothetical protein
VIRARDLVERVFWTFVSGFLSALLGTPLIQAVIENVAKVQIDVSALGAALIAATFAGFAAAANVVMVIARWRLSVLPDPGAGMPGLPTNRDDGATTIEAAGMCFVAAFLVVAIVLLL